MNIIVCGKQVVDVSEMKVDSSNKKASSGSPGRESSGRASGKKHSSFSDACDCPDLPPES